MIRLRPVETHEDVEAWIHVRRVVVPNESAGTVEVFRERAVAHPERLCLLAELDGRLAGSGLAGLSDSPGRGLVAPRVLPESRRQGVGTALLSRLAPHVAGLGVSRAGAHVGDTGSKAFAERFGFEEIDRQVEQVRSLSTAPDPAPIPDGVELVTIAERPALLQASYPLGRAGWEDFPAAEDVTISLEDWLRDEATLPEGSFVAIASGGGIVGYSGLCRHDDRGVAEDGLTVVDRAWRGRGLALAMKTRELAWAAENGYREVVTWTQHGNDPMRALNERLGYADRDFSITMAAPLPLP